MIIPVQKRQKAVLRFRSTVPLLSVPRGYHAQSCRNARYAFAASQASGSVLPNFGHRISPYGGCAYACEPSGPHGEAREGLIWPKLKGFWVKLVLGCWVTAKGLQRLGGCSISRKSGGGEVWWDHWLRFWEGSGWVLDVLNHLPLFLPRWIFPHRTICKESRCIPWHFPEARPKQSSSHSALGNGPKDENSGQFGQQHLNSVAQGFHSERREMTMVNCIPLLREVWARVCSRPTEPRLMGQELHNDC